MVFNVLMCVVFYFKVTVVYQKRLVVYALGSWLIWFTIVFSITTAEAESANNLPLPNLNRFTIRFEDFLFKTATRSF